MEFLSSTGLSHFYTNLKTQFIQAVAGAVTEEEIHTGAVTSTKIANYAVTTNKIEAGAVTATRIADGAVTDAKLAKAKADLDSDNKVNASQACSKIVTVSASRTLELSDAGKFLMCNSSSAITITIPSVDTVIFPMGTEIEFCRYGTGALTFEPVTGVTIRSVDSSLTAGDRYACVALKKIGSDVWILSGSLE